METSKQNPVIEAAMKFFDASRKVAVKAKELPPLYRQNGVALENRRAAQDRLDDATLEHLQAKKAHREAAAREDWVTKRRMCATSAEEAFYADIIKLGQQSHLYHETHIAALEAAVNESAKRFSAAAREYSSLGKQSSWNSTTWSAVEETRKRLQLAQEVFDRLDATANAMGLVVEKANREYGEFCKAALEAQRELRKAAYLLTGDETGLNGLNYPPALILKV